MKKLWIFVLVLALLLTTGCGGTTEESTPAATPEPTAEPTATTEPTPALPKLVKGTVQADNLPAILSFLARGDEVQVLGKSDDSHLKVETAQGTGTIETQLLRFAGDEAYEAWSGYARYNAEFYDNYLLAGEAVKKLSSNYTVEVLDELDSCYLVNVDDEIGYVDKEQVSENLIQSYYGGYDGGSSGGGGGVSSGMDGGDITLGYAVKEHYAVQLSDTVQTGSASSRIDGATVVLQYFQRGDEIQIVAEDGFVDEVDGYVAIMIDDQYAYLPQQWVLSEEDEAVEQREGYASYSCELFDNYLLQGDAMKKLTVNTQLTVLWDTGTVCVVDTGDEVGYVLSENVLDTATAIYYGGYDSGSSGGGSSGGDWTPPAL